MAQTYIPGQVVYYLPAYKPPVLACVVRTTEKRVILAFWESGARKRAVGFDTVMTVEMYNRINKKETA